MAIKLGIIGEPNTGKSFSRTFIDKGEEVFIIMPSAKAAHITDSSGKALKRLNISTPTSVNIEALAEKNKLTQEEVISKFALIQEPTITGNYVVTKLEYVQTYLQFVSKYMPSIKTIIIPDFTHYISAILADRKFIARKQGGEAFQRFWELAGDSLQNIIVSIDYLREDLVVVTEYHSEYNEVADSWEIFVPGGKMLKQAFKLDSYYDYMLYTHVVKKDSGEVSSYNFVTRKWDKYNARCSELFKETLIPNNLQVVLDKLREQNGI